MHRSFVPFCVNQRAVHVCVTKKHLRNGKVFGGVVHPTATSVTQHMGSRVRKARPAKRIVIGTLNLPVRERKSFAGTEDESRSDAKDALQCLKGLLENRLLANGVQSARGVLEPCHEDRL